MTGARLQSRLLGRDTDLATIDRFLAEIGDGFALFAIEGEPGIGKTALWEAALDSCHKGSVRTLIARPTEAETALSFVGLNDLLSGVEEAVWSEVPRSQQLALEGALLRTEAEPPVESGAIAIGFLSVLRVLASQGPLIIGVDDYQWLDRPTARVLEFGMRRLSFEPVRVLVTSRPVISILAGLERTLGNDLVTRLKIGPLSLSALYHLIYARSGVSLGRPTLLRVHETSGGNPFFALELARELLENHEGGYRGWPLAVPERLNDLLRQRLGRQSASTRRLLVTAAAMSFPRVEDLRRIAGRSSNLDVLAELDKAQLAGIIEVSDGAVRFSHPMLAAAAYAAASSSEQQRVHLLLAGYVADPDEQARHLALGSRDPDERVAMRLAEAANRASSRGATDAAAVFAEQALKLTPPGTQLYDRVMTAGDLALLAGNQTRARALFQQASKEASSGTQRAMALLRRAELANPLRDGIALCNEAMMEATDPSLLSRIQRTLGIICYSLGKVAEAEIHAREGVRLAEQGDDPRALGMALAELAHWTFCGGGGLRDDLFNRAIALEGSAGPTSPRSHRAKITMDAGYMEAARSQLNQLLSEAISQGDLRAVASHHLYLGELELWSGDWLGATEHADESLLLHEYSDQPNAPRYAKAMSQACLGRLDLARTEAEIGLAEAERSENVVLTMQSCHVLGFIELSNDNPGAAHIHLGRATDLLRTRWNREFGDARFVPDEVESLIALGELDGAEDLILWMERVGAATRRPWTLATAARSRGNLLAAQGKLDVADLILSKAVQQHQDVAMPFEFARTLLVKGTVERRLKHRTEAVSTLQQAHTIFAGLGSTIWARKATRELARIGIRSRRQLSLTPTEERIASLAAQGHNNREIAALLFVSRKTVEANLSHVYRKLGLRSRAQLWAALSQGGTATPKD